jgi:hypothetical protein
LADKNPTPARPLVPRKPWQRPALVVYGSVADLTGYPDEVDQVRSGVPSDRNLKEHLEPVDVQAVLAKLTALPIATWNYIADDAGVRHMGPMAQDFAAAFALGADDRHIHVIDTGGVAMASVQALHELVQEQGRQIALLRAEIGALRDKSGALERAR